MTRRLRAFVIAGAVGALAVCGVDGSEAQAQSIIKSPGDHPSYKVELEPHGLFGWTRLYSGNAFGLGFRATIPIVDNGFIPKLNNSIGITFGLDWLRYSSCNFTIAGREYGCGASFFVFPVAMQWNFWLTPKWSVFGEPGLYIYHGIYDDDYCRTVGNIGCVYPTRTSVEPAFYVGGRFHFNDTISLTMRIGYPTISIGASFFL